MDEEMAYPSEYGATTQALYIAKALEKKGAKLSTRKPMCGDFMFDYNGDLVGFYMGDDYIKLIPFKDK